MLLLLSHVLSCAREPLFTASAVVAPCVCGGVRCASRLLLNESGCSLCSLLMLYGSSGLITSTECVYILQAAGES